MGFPLGGTRARKLRGAFSYSRGIGGTYDGPCRPVKLGRPGKPTVPTFQQSVSLARLQPVGQHESARVPEQAVIGTCRQAAVHAAAVPVICSAVQGSPSSGQVVGQLGGGSQVSPAPIFLSPQVGAQSLSVSGEQAGGQQPSFETQVVIGAWLHDREHPSTEPVAWSNVHASPSSQVRAQAPGAPVVIARSQLSLVSTTPSPQIVGGQSLSSTAVQPDGQHSSPPTHLVTGFATQTALHLSARPCTS